MLHHSRRQSRGAGFGQAGVTCWPSGIATGVSLIRPRRFLGGVVVLSGALTEPCSVGMFYGLRWRPELSSTPVPFDHLAVLIEGLCIGDPSRLEEIDHFLQGGDVGPQLLVLGVEASDLGLLSQKRTVFIGVERRNRGSCQVRGDVRFGVEVAGVKALSVVLAWNRTGSPAEHPAGESSAVGYFGFGEVGLVGRIPPDPSVPPVSSESSGNPSHSTSLPIFTNVSTRLVRPPISSSRMRGWWPMKAPLLVGAGGCGERRRRARPIRMQHAESNGRFRVRPLRSTEPSA